MDMASAARGPNSPFAYLFLAITYGEAGREEDAWAAVKELRKRHPKFSVRRVAKAILFKNPAETERIVERLRRLGLPE